MTTVPMTAMAIVTVLWTRVVFVRIEMAMALIYAMAVTVGIVWARVG